MLYMGGCPYRPQQMRGCWHFWSCEENCLIVVDISSRLDHYLSFSFSYAYCFTSLCRISM
jgi:hypothetical protein